ncbi:MAG: response regulator [Thermodesulfobacteriota bacterium]|nr:response regulator [Thermodesulfobacteriota bacterium]
MPLDVERQRVLVIEVEQEMKIFLSNLLATGGFEPVVFEGPIEGLGKFKSAEPSLIILDAMMPKAEGIQIYRNIKHDETLKHVPIIILSNIDRKSFLYYLKSQDSFYGQKVPGPNAYLEKPPETEHLLGLVRMLTGKD